MFKRRLGAAPVPGKTGSGGANGCPDIWELESGDFAVIGLNSSAELRAALPSGAFLDDGETLVVLPRHVLVKAREDIPFA